MEFLDPKKRKAHLIRLMIGYALIATALILTTIILLYQAYGFGLKNGEVIQNGLIFVSTRPNPADIYVDGKKEKQTTNTRLLMPAGKYVFDLKREGYRDWKRAITVEGGSVGRFDYPVLFPTKLTTTTTKKYDTPPSLTTQSPDHRWLVVQNSGAAYNTFDLFDLNEPAKAPGVLTVPTSLFTLGDGTHQWKFVEWSSDNSHMVLQHLVTKDDKQTSEYVLVDREDMAKSVNLTKTLGVNPSKLELRDKKYDKYYLYDEATQLLNTATLEEPKPVLVLDHVLAFKTHGDDKVLYATSLESPEGKATVKLKEDDKTYTIRQVAAGSPYMLDLASYSDDWYIVAGASSESRTYVYKDPAGKLQDKPKATLVPVQVLKTANPTFVDFSDNARLIVAESGQQFAIYDAETDKGYAYTTKLPLDGPQAHATWMDGHRLMYVSGGKTFVFDFDDANREILSSADANYLPLFDRKYEFLYSFTTQTVKNSAGQDVQQFGLSSTSLLSPADQ